MPVEKAHLKRLHAPECKDVPEQPRKRNMRRASFVVEWKFDGTNRAKVSIEQDFGRKTVQLVIRPFRRRSVIRRDLGDLAQRLAETDAGAGKLKRRRRRV